MLNIGLEDVGLRLRSPSSLGSTMQRGYRYSGADYSQHLWVKMLHFIQLIKVPEGAVKSVKQKEMHINSLHRIRKRGELCPCHLASSSVLYMVRQKKMRE